MKKENIPAYEIVKQENLTDIHSVGYLLRHKKTGARLVLVENDDENKPIALTSLILSSSPQAQTFPHWFRTRTPPGPRSCAPATTSTRPRPKPS